LFILAKYYNISNNIDRNNLTLKIAQANLQKFLKDSQSFQNFDENVMIYKVIDENEGNSFDENKENENELYNLGISGPVLPIILN
jgi:hypothetical protein